MEVNSAVRPQGQEVAAQAAKVAAPEGGKKSVSLPVIEIKAPPKVAEYEPKGHQAGGRRSAKLCSRA